MENTLVTYFNPDNIKLAYYRVLCWTDRMVKDRFGLHAFGADLNNNARQLSERIISGQYKPQRGFKFYEPKSTGTQRTKTLLMVEDALVYQAIANKIAERVYPQLTETENFVFGSVLIPEVVLGEELLRMEKPNYFFFRYWKTLYQQFKDSVIQTIEDDKTTHKFETDITGFFDSIPHYNLLLTLSQDFNVEDEILDILSECFNVWSGTKMSSTPGVGIPQGPQPSFFFANLLLHPLDKDVIGEAFKYYRYMDDINIYGYSEQELLDVLVKIDNYLKGHGLSINSKKTRIEKIDHSKEDETVSKLKRLQTLGESYDGDFDPDFDDDFDIDFDEFNEPDKKKEPDVSKNLSTVFEQTGDLFEEAGPDLITDRSAIIEFWKNEMAVVERELPALFKLEGNDIGIIDDEKTDDVELIRWSARYGAALKALGELEEVSPDPDLLKYWIYSLRKFFWRAGILALTLQHYRGDNYLKQELIKLLMTLKNYESFKYHLIICLTYNFTYTDKELRDFYKWIKDEESELVKYALYCLVIKNSRNPQLLSSVKSSLAKEPNNYLKCIVLDYWKRDSNRIETMSDLVKSIGL